MTGFELKVQESSSYSTWDWIPLLVFNLYYNTEDVGSNASEEMDMKAS